VAICNLHHSIPPHEIQAELETLGHKVRNILNIRHSITKEPLPLYFVDLESQDNNKSTQRVPGERDKTSEECSLC
jgi:hypothetical protein